MAPIEKTERPSKSHMTQLDPSRATFSNFSTNIGGFPFSLEIEMAHEEAPLRAPIGGDVEQLARLGEPPLERADPAVLGRRFPRVDRDVEARRRLLAGVEHVHVEVVPTV